MDLLGPVSLIPIIFTELFHDLTNCLLIGANHDLCQDRFSTDLSLGIWGSGFGLALRPECCIARIALPEGWEGQPSA